MKNDYSGIGQYPTPCHGIGDVVLRRRRIATDHVHERPMMRPKSFHCICHIKAQTALKLGSSVGIGAPNRKNVLMIFQSVVALCRLPGVFTPGPAEAGIECLKAKINEMYATWGGPRNVCRKVRCVT